MLDNPKHEAVARAIFEGITKDGVPTYHDAYRKAYPNSAQGNSTYASASRLLRKAKILDRVNELINQSAKTKRVSIETICDEYNEARAKADKLDQVSVMLAASQAKAKLFGLDITKIETRTSDFSNCSSMDEIGRKLLMQVGVEHPSPQDISDAIAANDALVLALEAIAQRSQTLMIES